VFRIFLLAIASKDYYQLVSTIFHLLVGAQLMGATVAERMRPTDQHLET